MKKPFVIIDHENQQIIFIINTIIKIINLSDLEKNNDFFDEFYRRFETCNIIVKYSEINRKDILNVIGDLKTKFTPSSVVQSVTKKQEVREIKPEKKIQVSEKEKELERSTLVRSASERKISVEDLKMRFDYPYDFYDLATFDDEKLNKSTQLNYFLKKGLLVKTTYEEINAIKSKCDEEKSKLDDSNRKKSIVNRKDILGDEDEGLVMSDETFKQATGNSSASSHSAEPIDIEADEVAGEIASQFGGQKSLEAILQGGKRGGSVDDLLRDT